MIRVRQVRVSVLDNSYEAILKSTSRRLHVDPPRIDKISIVKQSIDARFKDNIFYIYEVDCTLKREIKILNSTAKDKDVFLSPSMDYEVEVTGEKVLTNKPVIVGAGPCGLFAALNLLENGIKPIIIERGKTIDERVKDVSEFIKNNNLNEESNIQFGEGGAGTFSDGKLNTMIKDKENRTRKVLETFVECGANEDILYSYKPHIGTDLLREVIKNLRKRIEDLGGEFYFNTKLTNIITKHHQVIGIEVNNERIIDTEVVILAIGNSARDTFEMLVRKNIPMSSKPFAVGLRIMHPQDLIDNIQYGEKFASILSPATYKLTHTTSSKRGVYTFCMCPGGYIINASSEKGRLAINGMSYHKRNSGFANSAIVVTVTKEDFGERVLDGLKFQRYLEKKCFALGEGKIPVQTLKDFYNNELTDTSLPYLQVEGEYKFANINKMLPPYISESIKEAIDKFDELMPGFKCDYAILAAIETRTSSPVRISRGENGSSRFRGLYPAGEGAGYSGGITSSAVDGLKIAECILKEYKQEDE